MFQLFLQQVAIKAKKLYILGDLFDVWIGDDALNTHSSAIISALLQCHHTGIDIALMHGNRDFLIGAEFCKLSGCHLIDDPSIITLNNQPVLLCHGDTLCTDDVDYQAFRLKVRAPAFQQAFLALAINQRQQQVRGYRSQSKAATRVKTQDIMDVNAAAVRQSLAKHKVTCLIHGHTHRPAIHTLDNDSQRLVLGDWGKTGSVLVHNDNGFQLHSFNAATIAQLASTLYSS